MRHSVTHLFMIGMLAAGAYVGPSAAQTKTDFMEGYPFEYKGKVGGLDAWALPDQEDMWFVLPDGKTAIAGFAFNEVGDDLVAGVLGYEPISAKDSLSAIFGAEGLDVSALTPEVGAGFPQIQHMDMEGRPYDQEDLIADMISDLDASTTPEEFQNVLRNYAEKIASGTVASGTSETGGAVPPVQVMPTTNVIAPTYTGQSGAGVVAPVNVPDQEDHSMITAPKMNEEVKDQIKQASYAVPSDATEFLKVMQDDTFWFSAGDRTSPAVYMFYDPSCPYCARAILNLEPRIKSGEFHLRLIPVPAVSKNSLGLLAGLLSSTDPEGMVFENSRQLAGQGKTAITAKDPSSMAKEFLEGTSHNMTVSKNLEIPGVPFFGWQSETGPHFLSGVPAMDYNFALTGR